jgi:hypothetical protein
MGSCSPLALTHAYEVQNKNNDLSSCPLDELKYRVRVLAGSHVCRGLDKVVSY